MGLLHWIRGLICDGVDELFPHACASAWRDACAGGWSADAGSAYCGRCGVSAGAGAATPAGCPACLGRAVAWNQIIRLGPYRPPLQEWIVQMKFQRLWTWSRWLGPALATTMKPALARPQKTAVCPVPMHWSRRWGRGYNQSHLLARQVGATLHLPVVPLLRRVRRTVPQTQIAPSQREQNIRGSFAAGALDATGWDVWLIDDVKTSGSTLTACCKLLQKIGAHRITVGVVAVAEPKAVIPAEK